MESNSPEVLDARGDQGALEIKSLRNQGLLHSDVDYIECARFSFWYIFLFILNHLNIFKLSTISPHHYVKNLDFMGILFPVHPDLP